MLVDFQRVSVKGFLSIGEAELDLSGQGMVYVTGRNESPGNQDSNGAGKSTLFEAIMYALTGTTLRGTKDVINIYWKGYTEVTLDLSVDGVGYSVMRTRKHPKYGNNLKIWRDGEDISGDKLKKSEAILANELGQLTSTLISSVIILGQGLPNKFTDLSPMGRKDRLEELSQSSEFIGEFRTRLSNFKSLYEGKRNANDLKMARAETLVDTTQSRITETIGKLDELEGNSDDLDELEGELEAERAEVERLQGTMRTLTDLRSSTNEAYNMVTSEMQVKESRVRFDSSEVSRIASELSDLGSSTCPTCHQPIKSGAELERLRAERESRVRDLQGEMRTLSVDVEELDRKRAILESKVANLDNRYRSIQDAITVGNRKVVETVGRMDRLRDTTDGLRAEIESLTGKVEEGKGEIAELSSVRGTYDLKLGIIDYLAKKSSKEFRSFMLSGVVEYLNTKLSYYGQRLFGTDRLSLVLDGNKILITYDNRLYENLSGGERQRADLAMQFSLRDMLINSLGFDCNLLVIDEGFDNLDSSGVDALVSVINGMTSIDSVFTISHHTLSIPFDRTIEVVKGLDKVSSVHEVI